MSKTVRLHITIIIFACPDIPSFGFDHICDHIIDKSVLIPDLLSFEIFLIFLFVYFLEDILESTIILLQNGILSGQIQRILSLKCKLEAAVSKAVDTFISVVHAHTDTSSSFVVIDFHFLFCSIIAFEQDLKFAWLINNEIGGFVLVSESMTSDYDWFFPAWDKSRNILDDNRLTENSTIKNISDSTIRTFPHFLQLELLNSSLIRSNSGTFNTNFTLFDSISSINSNLIVSGITMLHSKIKIFNIDV